MGPWPTGPNDPHEGWGPGEESEGPPGIEESDGEDTIPYRDAESDDDDDDQCYDSALVFLEKKLIAYSFTQCLKEDRLE